MRVIIGVLIGIWSVLLGAPLHAREMVLYEAPAQAPAPLVIALHGGLGSAKQFDRMLSLENLTKSGIHVAYVNGGHKAGIGARRIWLAGRCCTGWNNAHITRDVDHLDAVIKQLVRQGKVDPKRIALVGYSNGAMMGYRYICARPDRIRIFVALAGALVMDECKRGIRTSIIAVHGEADQNVPLSGGQSRLLLKLPTQFPPFTETREVMINAGARFEPVIIAGAGHGLRGLWRGFARARGISIETALAQALVARE